MTQISERHIRLIKKDQELEKLFEEAAHRRRKLLQQKDKNEKYSYCHKVENRDKKLLRSSDNLTKRDDNHNTVILSSGHMCRNLQKSSTFYSHQNLPETNLDIDTISLHKSKPCSNNNNYNHEDCVKSNENLNKSGHHNLSFVTYSSSSDEVDICNYCQFIPATSSSTNNTTSSSHYSKTDNSTGKLSSLEPSSSDAGAQSVIDIDNNTQSVRDVDGNTHKESSMVFYPSGSPLIRHRYQGSPVVRLDNKLRAGEADYLINRPKPTTGKPPLMPRRIKAPFKPLTYLATAETRLSHPNLIDINENNQDPSSPVSTEKQSNAPSSIIRRTKKKLLEEHMRKRFSVGDYSTRALIEWENNLNCADIERLSMSGDLHTTNESDELTKRNFFSRSDVHLPLEKISTAHNFSSAINILHCNSTDSFKDPQVSFSLKNDKNDDDKSHCGHSDKFFKRTNFIRRSMNDIVAVLRNVTASEKVPSSKRFTFSNKSHFHGIFKKRDSTSSDLLYSVPPFVRRHLPPDISGGTKILTQGTYQNCILPSSTPNLIAELDPTFHERYPLDNPPHENIINPRQPSSKRNRSYRLSFIENAHTVTTKKLTATNISTSPANAAVLRFVQPRRRMASRNSAMTRRHDSPRTDTGGNSRSRSSNRFSCAQQ